MKEVGPIIPVERSIVFREPGRFAGWPANYGMWAWGEEILAIYIVGWVGPLHGMHARDTSRPFVPVQSRSLDGGRTWRHEPFPGRIPGGRTLSGDEHVDRELKSRPRIREADFAVPAEPVDFTDPETIVLCGRTDLERGSVSWFYVSRDRGRTWSRPHRLPMFGLAGVSARTDVVPLARHSALFLLTGTKSDGTEGRVFAARTGDGGRNFERVGYVGPEPAGWSIMPSSLMLADGTIVSALRCSDPDTGHRIEMYASNDEGRSWVPRSRPVADTGRGGNPPALIRVADGRLVIVYGYRDEPRGLRAVVSADSGHSWSTPAVLTADTPSHDMGYPRVVGLGDGRLLAVFYSNSGPESDRFIEAVRWAP
ncbi:MAG TPA: sialidase family protein [Mycobacteriales bacterium]|nr:sialidase family protein [Mycobacteriales bacterium]